MLEFYFKSPERLEQTCNGPLAEHIDDLAAKLYRRGFTQATGHRVLSLTAKLNGLLPALVSRRERESMMHSSSASSTRS